MGNKQSYIVNNSGTYMNNGGPVASNSTSIPVNLSEGLNTVTYEIPSTTRHHIYNIINQYSHLNMLDSNPKIEQCVYEVLMEDGTIDMITLDEAREMGFFDNLTMGNVGAILGKLSANAAVQGVVTKGLSRIQNIVESTLGNKISTGVLNKVSDLTSNLPPTIRNLFHGVVRDMPVQGTGIEKIGNVTIGEDRINVKSNIYPGLSNNILPGVSYSTRVASTSNNELVSRGRIGRYREMTGGRKLLTANGCGHYSGVPEKDHANRVIDHISNLSNPPTMTVNTDDGIQELYCCAQSAIGVGAKKIDAVPLISALADVFDTSYSCEQRQVEAQTVAGVVSGSTPGIINTVDMDVVNRMVKNLTVDQQDVAAEIGRLAGGPYGILIGDKDNAAEGTIMPETLQTLVNQMPITTVDYGRVSTVERYKDYLRRDFPTDSYDIETLIASPRDISLTDINSPQFFSKDWLEVYDPVANSLSLGHTRPYTMGGNGAFSVSNFLYSATSSSISATPNFDALWGIVAGAQPVFPPMGLQNLVNGQDAVLLQVLPYNYMIQDIWNDYEVITDLTINARAVYSPSASDTGESVNNNYPLASLEVMVGIILLDDQGVKNVFLPLKGVSKNSPIYRATIENAALGPNPNGLLMATVEDKKYKPSYVIGMGGFTIGMATTQASIATISQGGIVPGTWGPKYNWKFSLSVQKGTSHLLRKTTSQSIGHWIWRGTPVDSPLASYFFSLHANDVTTSHPYDVLNYWYENVVSKFNPYVDDICKMLSRDINSVIVSKMFVVYEKCMENTSGETPINNPAITITNFKDEVLIPVVKDIGGWFIIRGNSPLWRFPSTSVHIFCIETLKMMRMMVLQIPYLKANITTVQSALENINNDSLPISQVSVIELRKATKARHGYRITAAKPTVKKVSHMLIANGW
jgi:uncharacterized membrane protein YeaQ/YmgE (transglycosylase-associated protein family)